MKINLTIAFLFLFGLINVKAQKPQTYSSSELLMQIKKLKVVGSVLYIAAHPDDENTKLLAYLANEKKYRTGYLSLTRGDGGQNLIGDEQGIDLGLIRTQELLAARRIDGAEQYFSSAYDFGYSKNPDEALRIWGHDKILSDVVWVIRKFRPDVIICRFPTTGEGGHGQHTASAILAEEAFNAAADSNKFKEQLSQGVNVWQATRLLWNTFNFGSINTQKEDQFKIDVGVYSSLLGKSYGEIAAESRSQHKSQGFGVPAQRGSSTEYFKTIKGTPPVIDLFDGINTDWSRFLKDSARDVKDIFDKEVEASWHKFPGESINNKIDSIINKYNPEKSEQAVEGLVELYNSLFNQQGKYLSSLNYWILVKCKELMDLFENCGGFHMETISSEPKVVIGDTIKLNYSFINRTGIKISSADVSFGHHQFNWDVNKINQTLNINDTDHLEKNIGLSQPYFLHRKIREGYYPTEHYSDLGNPENAFPKATFYLKYAGTPFLFEKNIMYKNTDPIKGERYQPVAFIPPVYLEPEESVVIRKNKGKAFVNLKVTANKDIVIKSLKANDKELLNDTMIVLKKQQQQTFKVFLEDETTAFKAFVESDTFNLYAREIKYDHIPAITYFKNSEVICTNIDFKMDRKKIGYIEGAGDKVAEALMQIGFEVTILKKEDIFSENLKKFDAVITGVRAYNTNEWLNEVYDVLMNYIKAGGLLLVQYNTSNQIGPLKAKIGPYPFNISRNRVTDENAKVILLKKDNSIFNYPNKIGDTDFMNWIQERSIYHAIDIDSHYQKLISMHDPQEKEDEGSLIVADYGKGKFIYTGLSLFRQLPAGVSGAYRLFVNLINSK